MVNCLLLIKKIIDFNKKDIDKGNTPHGLYKICSCIREMFCLSYAIRKENNLFLFFRNNLILIKFVGTKLKYLGPDERSQTMLILKALDKINYLENENWMKSTPGIYVRKFPRYNSFINYLKSLESFNPIFITNYINNQEVDPSFTLNKFEGLDNLFEFFFIIPFYNIGIEDPMFFESFRDLIDIKFLTLSKINRIEDIFLYINFRLDLSRR